MFYGHYRHISREVLCFECLGDGCKACNEEGRIVLPEENEDEQEFIPYHKRPKNDGMFKSYMWLKQYNVFPDEGGWMDQSAKFIRMVDWCDLVHSKWSAYIKERSEAGAKLSRQLGAMIGKK